VLNDKVGQAFSQRRRRNQLRVAGMPKIEPKQDAPEGMLAFDATFEVYPEVSLPATWPASKSRPSRPT
jgi:trigger factor